MRRRKLPPDTRPKWNDPDLKVLYRGVEYLADDYKKLCQHALQTDMTPNYKHDKTYDLRKSKFNL